MRCFSLYYLDFLEAGSLEGRYGGEAKSWSPEDKWVAWGGRTGILIRQSALLPRPNLTHISHDFTKALASELMPWPKPAFLSNQHQLVH